MIEIERILDCIRKHRDQHGDDRCWMDDNELYENTLPEGINGADLRLHAPCEMIINCAKYIAHRQDPSIPYVSPQRTIEELEAKIAGLTIVIDQEYYRGLGLGYRFGYEDGKCGSPPKEEYYEQK
jgi:hypothetical protein